jgi:uncharacterized protein
MLRVVKTDKGVAVDPGQVLPGRGAYVHQHADCLDIAVRRGGLARTLKCQVPEALFTDRGRRKDS